MSQFGFCGGRDDGAERGAGAGLDDGGDDGRCGGGGLIRVLPAWRPW
jgi:hypothetical protein